MRYDTVIVGGGFAGLQAAIQLGRYAHDVLVLDSGGGRSSLCRSYHNILGYPGGVPGETLRRTGREQAEALGVRFAEGRASTIRWEDDREGFVVVYEVGEGSREQFAAARTVLVATGVSDRFPDVPGLVPCLGLTVYVCPDCDGYEVRGKRTIVLGAGDSGASMALTLTYWTERLLYVNHERKPVSAELDERLREQGIERVDEAIAEVLLQGAPEQGQFSGVRLENGRRIEGERGFIAFGGNAVHSGLVRELGVECLENRHIVTDPRSKATNVPGIWAAGDIGVHAEQVTVALGEGSLAAIWIHKALMAKAKA